MILLISALFLMCYVVFVFTADQMNPFARPQAPLKRRRWRLGRRCAFTLLVVGVLFLLNALYVVVEGWWQLAVLIGVAGIMLWPAIRRFQRTRQWAGVDTVGHVVAEGQKS